MNAFKDRLIEAHEELVGELEESGISPKKVWAMADDMAYDRACETAMDQADLLRMQQKEF